MSSVIMKKIITLILILSSIFLSKLHAQNLYNTYWTHYDTSGTIISYAYFGTDTLFVSQDNINYTAVYLTFRHIEFFSASKKAIRHQFLLEVLLLVTFVIR